LTTLYLDLETFSDVPIAHGTHRYAARAEVLLIAWALDTAPVQVADLTEGLGLPVALRAALLDRAVDVVIHNSAFDRTVLRHALGIDLAPERIRDTMVRALAHGLPGSLGELCGIFKLPTDQAKDKDGRQLIHLFCKPRPKTSKITRATRATHPAEWARFTEYARLDVEAMRAIAARLPRWNDSAEERALWCLDQRINDRGVSVDLPLAEGAVAAVAQAQAGLARQAHTLTDGALAATTQRDALLAHLLAEHGVDLPDLQKSTLERRLQDTDLAPELRELLANRLAATTTSTAKYNTLLRATSADGRLRGTLQFCGASRTGRWAGRLFQPQNLARPTLPQAEIDAGVGALKLGCADLLTGDVMALASNALRGAIVAPSGRKLVVADLANIEGRVLAWLAGENWKLRAFRAFDQGAGADLYKTAYARAFAIQPDAVAKDQRQIGKVMELMLGYEGGVGAFLTGAATYGIDLDAMAAAALPGIPADVRGEAGDFLDWRRAQKLGDFGLSDEAFIACDSLKRLWRQAHPATAALWRALQDACIAAVTQRGQVAQVGRLDVRTIGAWLRIRLPSGRVVCYPGAAVGEDGKLSYLGVNQYSRKWERLKTYGGKLVENVTQAVARDVLAASMPAIEAAGYQIVLTVHDEVICEAPDTPEFNPADLARLMAINPEWAEGLPLAAAGFEAHRYRKD
jgi:DNA polymerase